MNISIITATFNAATTIADCLASVHSQHHTGTGTCGASPLEHIIIDGASTDGTLDIISRLTSHASHLTRLISEKDHGIYDAMNKGIALATGEVIGILNADDFYAAPDVLAKVAQAFQDPAVMCCYGDLEYVKETREGSGDRGQGAGVRREALGVRGQASGDGFYLSPLTPHDLRVFRYWKSGLFAPDRFYWGWMPPHPTFFVRRSVYERYGTFRLDMGSAADYELMLRLLLKERIRTVYIPEVLVRMRVGGASNETLSARLKANRMDRRAWEVNGLRPWPWTLLCKPLRKLPQYLLRKC